jgi:hypothetical protein
MFPLLASFSELAGRLIEAPIDGSTSIARTRYRNAHEANNYREPVKEHSSTVAFASVGAET